MYITHRGVYNNFNMGIAYHVHSPFLAYLYGIGNVFIVYRPFAMDIALGRFLD